VISVPVELGERRYDVVVGSGCIGELAAIVAAKVPTARRAAVVTQSGIGVSVETGLPTEAFTVPDGEEGKSLSVVEELCRGFARFGLSRSDVVVAVGGGVVTDLAGFAAASFHRGTAYVNVATTLLAQVDAAVGGKTGVNLPEGKNLVGAFWQPRAVLCDPDVLSTLPPREWASGRGEMAKYAFLGGTSGAGDGPDASLLDLSLEEQVARCVAIKAAVVASDEREGDQRMVLNYGHTLAHALEAAAFEPGSGLDLRHGEAVAIGLVYAALLARRLGRIDDDRVDLHRQVVGAFDLSSAVPAPVDPELLVSFMTRDKKAQRDLTFVLDGPDGVEVVRGVDRADVLATLADMEAHNRTASRGGSR
jgi:5-deoxy-5-amino-3-dehydroquinate synthase